MGNHWSPRRTKAHDLALAPLTMALNQSGHNEPRPPQVNHTVQRLGGVGPPIVGVLFAVNSFVESGAGPSNRHAPLADVGKRARPTARAQQCFVVTHMRSTRSTARAQQSFFRHAHDKHTRPTARAQQCFVVTHMISTPARPHARSNALSLSSRT